MNGPSPLDDDYVRKHARAGEDWAPARDRLEGEVAHRYRHLPVCEICAAQSTDMAGAADRHRLSSCWVGLDAWPAAALSPRLFDAAHAQSVEHTRAQAAIARIAVRNQLTHIERQPHPINALMTAVKAEGYLAACDALGLFERAELVEWQLAVYAAQERARTAFIEQYHRRDPETLPWRAAKIPVPE